VPIPDDWTRPYWEAAREHRLVVQTCVACGAVQYPPDVRCRVCAADSFEFRDVPRKATLYSFAVFERSFVSSFEPPYVVALVELPACDGVRMLMNIVETPIGDLKIGMRLEVVFEERDGWSVPQCRAERHAIPA
jgi:uncharacterized OB-fold protein